MKKSTMCFIVAPVVFVLGIIVQSIGFATASTEAELAARASENSFWWILGAAVVSLIVGIILKKKGD